MKEIKYLISSDQFNQEFLFEIFQLADSIRQNPHMYHSKLTGQVIATLFFEPSTRTRLSFESAIQRLGASLITVENGKLNSSATKGESLLDTIRIVQGYSDAIVMRHNENDASERAQTVALVPIINAGDGSGEHPTQALLDLYTIYSYKNQLDNLGVAVVGDLRFGRTVHSLVKALSLFDNITIYGVSNEEFKLPNKYIDFLRKRNVNYISCEELSELPYDIDVIYQTRIQDERFEEDSLEKKVFTIDRKILEGFDNETIVLHPLPRNEEILEEVDNDHRAVYFQQSKNGLYVRMALLLLLLSPEHNTGTSKREDVLSYVSK